MLEIGVGGYDSPISGESLRMWKTYFPFAKIFALDILISLLEEKDQNFLKEVKLICV
jgi:demethylmacrocin O-methyltransferase